ncbi:MAG: sulfotransferase [candidate division WOR-3 bacterium]|nr:sulfotransferase [candidate division WOR-3 bacterium]
MLPDFIIIGAMKCGTGSLYKYLSTHPEITPSTVKETNFFLREESSNSEINYRHYFKGNGKYAFEASPNYSKRHLYPGVPERMHSLLPNIKLIYLVRDPIERIRSHYVHNFCHGRESNTFSEVIRKNNNYMLTSRYFFQIQAFLEFYKKDNILVVQSEQLMDRTEQTVNSIFQFLNISPDYDHSIINRRFHKSSSKRRSTVFEQCFREKTQNKYLLGVLKKSTRIFGKTVDKPQVSPDDEGLLREQLQSDTEKLRELTGQMFNGWQL